MVKRFAARSPMTATRKAKTETELARRLLRTAPSPTADTNRTDMQNTIRGRRLDMRLPEAFMVRRSGGPWISSMKDSKSGFGPRPPGTWEAPLRLRAEGS